MHIRDATDAKQKPAYRRIARVRIRDGTDAKQKPAYPRIARVRIRDGTDAKQKPAHPRIARVRIRNVVGAKQRPAYVLAARVDALPAVIARPCRPSLQGAAATWQGRGNPAGTAAPGTAALERFARDDGDG